MESWLLTVFFLIVFTGFVIAIISELRFPHDDSRHHYFL